MTEPCGLVTLETQLPRKLATVIEFDFVMVVGFVLVTYAWFEGPVFAGRTLDLFPDAVPRLTKPTKGSRADDVVREALKTFDRTIRMAFKGESYFSVPDSVSRYDEFKVAFTVGPKERHLLLERALKEANPQSTSSFAAKDLPLTRTMTATLAEDRFTITPTNQATQAISVDAPTTWTWLVSAKEAGRLALAARVRQSTAGNSLMSQWNQ